MSFDSTKPNLKSTKDWSCVEATFALSDVKPMSTSHGEENPILPESEVKSVIIYLKSNPAFIDVESNSVVPCEEVNPNLVNPESNFVAADEDVNSTLVNPESNFVPSDEDANSDLIDSEPNLVVSDEDVSLTFAHLDLNSVFSEEESNSVSLDLDILESPLLNSAVNPNIQVQIKSEDGRLLLILPTESQVPASEYSWSDIWQQMKLRLLACDRSFSPNTSVHLVAQDRLLDGRQLQELAETLNQFEICLKSVSTSRRQTAIAAVSAGYSVEQVKLQQTLGTEEKPPQPPLAEPLYLEKTLRSGEEIRHPGHVILLGDLNPGGILVAEGDILVWGRLRGIAHAGAGGDRKCLIMALQMEPTQLRIADTVARAPEKPPTQFHPEVAYITPQGIRIARASDFSKILLNRINQQNDEV
ncbi:MAG: septum site-determining protein MinC [Scytonema sp. PMC 1069.18]|nr:septum site-determining protein MinC [Scytonema sp. PMC 1069.18]MEC4887772.1 septum site-determining protein MinC [Scytonema sp. PMC 1070.18]